MNRTNNPGPKEWIIDMNDGSQHHPPSTLLGTSREVCDGLVLFTSHSYSIIVTSTILRLVTLKSKFRLIVSPSNRRKRGELKRNFINIYIRKKTLVIYIVMFTSFLYTSKISLTVHVCYTIEVMIRKLKLFIKNWC